MNEHGNRGGRLSPITHTFRPESACHSEARAHQLVQLGLQCKHMTAHVRPRRILATTSESVTATSRLGQPQHHHVQTLSRPWLLQCRHKQRAVARSVAPGTALAPNGCGHTAPSDPENIRNRSGCGVQAKFSAAPAKPSCIRGQPQWRMPPPRSAIIIVYTLTRRAGTMCAHDVAHNSHTTHRSTNGIQDIIRHILAARAKSGQRSSSVKYNTWR